MLLFERAISILHIGQICAKHGSLILTFIVGQYIPYAQALCCVSFKCASYLYTMHVFKHAIPLLHHSTTSQALHHSTMSQALHHSATSQALHHSTTSHWKHCTIALRHKHCTIALRHKHCTIALCHKHCTAP